MTEILTKARRKDAWAWTPPLPLQGIPVLVWPPRPGAALRWFASVSFVWSVLLPFGGTATIAWLYLQPALERCIDFRMDWLLQMFVRNLALMVLVAGGLHLYLHTFERQGSEKKFAAREPPSNNRKYLGGKQVRDNMFWSCVSGVTVWTAYEAVFMWAYANELLPFYLDWARHPFWLALTFVAIVFWSSLHFYFIHRLLHWKPLYKIAHAVHHRNGNLGPWSGLSMHPIEHVIYLSSVLLHLLIASHPIHILFHMHWNTLGAAASHAGFESLTFRGKTIMRLTAFHHQLHHRHYNCNYGNEYTPCDRWFGTEHDGTQEAMARIRERQRMRHGSAVRGG